MMWFKVWRSRARCVPLITADLAALSAERLANWVALHVSNRYLALQSNRFLYVPYELATRLPCDLSAAFPLYARVGEPFLGGFLLAEHPSLAEIVI
jgi:hypothetical protein